MHVPSQTCDIATKRRAVGYVRVSTEMQATDGLSLDAQRAAIEQYCATQGHELVAVHMDVVSGAKAQRPGLTEALVELDRGVDILVVLKFDRLSRSIKHFCELYERYFRSGSKELVAIRESIRLDSSLGRALVNILMVFAQMEREATGERTRETLRHIRARGYHHGKVPYGQRAVPAADNPRFRVLVEEPAEQAVLLHIRQLLDEKVGIVGIAARLNAEGVQPPQGVEWTKSILYNLRLRLKWRTPKRHNKRWHSEQQLKEHAVELRLRGQTSRQIAASLNEQNWIPLKASKFTETSIHRLLASCDETEHLTPKRYLEMVLERRERDYQEHFPDGKFQRPGFQQLACLLAQSGYVTPKGHTHWWPAQVQHLLAGRFDHYYQQPQPAERSR